MGWIIAAYVAGFIVTAGMVVAWAVEQEQGVGIAFVGLVSSIWPIVWVAIVCLALLEGERK